MIFSNRAPFRNEMSPFLSAPEIEGTFGRESYLRVLERDVRAQFERDTAIDSD